MIKNRWANQRMNQKESRNAPREQVDSALRLSRRDDDLESAAQALSSLAADYPEDLEVRFAAASVLFRLDRYAEAIPHFEKLLPTQPTNEWVSLGLFHSFLKSARKREALEELRRFDQAGGESMEYRRLQKDINRVMNGPEAED
ncbi:MAG: tetratricopeptide repeat protein [Thermoanaerobaculia bacterium]